MAGVHPLDLVVVVSVHPLDLGLGAADVGEAVVGLLGHVVDVGVQGYLDVDVSGADAGAIRSVTF